MRGEVASGRSQVSQSDLRVHFGLGAATRVDRLEVRWANGPTVAYEVPGVDRIVNIDQSRGVLEPRPASSTQRTQRLAEEMGRDSFPSVLCGPPRSLR
jgi:hypothetical protein